MKFSSVIAFALLSTAATTLASPLKRAADAATQQANANDAIALNQKFATLTPDSACTNGQNACVNGMFAQCSNGKFALSPCAGGLTCCALPLVNSRGTSITCDTAADRDARIARAQGAGGAAAPPTAPTTPTTPTTPATPTTAPTTPTTPPSNGGTDIASIRKQNAADAQALENQFKSLTTNSPCTTGNACINGMFAQCSGGKFATTACAGGTQCFVLPLVNKKGTSVTCDTQADRDARFAAALKGQS